MTTTPKSLKRKRIFTAVSIVVAVGLLVWLSIVVGRPLVELASDPEQFRLWIDSKGMLGYLIMIGIQLLQVIIAFIPGEVVEIGAGYAFGAFEGTILCLLGTALGSALIFVLVKRYGMKVVEIFVSREKIENLKFLRDARRLNVLIFVVFFIPGTPKDLLTYFVGLTPMRLPTFLALSTVARIPSVISSTFGGSALGSQDYTFAIVVFVVTGLLSAVGLFAYNRYVKRKNEAGEGK